MAECSTAVSEVWWWSWHLISIVACSAHALGVSPTQFYGAAAVENPHSIAQLMLLLLLRRL